MRLILSFLFLASSLWAGQHKIGSDSQVAFTIVKTKSGKTYDIPGTFSGLSGTYTIKGDKVTALSASLDVSTIDTAHAKRDRKVQNEDYLNVPINPTISFLLTSHEGDTLTGQLTMAGVTKPFSVKVKVEGDSITATGTLRRSNHDYFFAPKMLADEVALVITLKP